MVDVDIKIFGTQKNILKNECYIDNELTVYYKGKKIEIGLKFDESMMVVFVDNTWLTYSIIEDFENPSYMKLLIKTTMLTVKNILDGYSKQVAG